ncbi:MAG TPA: hypothetical protein VL137_01270 [Polyangiaceae bacterium]|nr:hypothetical protein [Polyangiaceae bacterium]
MNELNPDARRLVSLAREGRTPDEGDKSRVAERLALAIAAGTAAGTAAGVAKAAATAEVAGAGAKVVGSTLLGSMGAKIAAVALLGAVSTAVVVGQMSSKQSAPSSANAGAVQIQRVAPAPHIADAPIAPAEPAAEQSTAEPAVEPKAPLKSTAPAVQSNKPSLAEEAALLHQAQSAWRAGQSAEALRLANEHAQRFPHSQLGNERDVLRVLSLCKLGQIQAAQQIGARLLLKAQDSPWYESVAHSCAAK